MDERKTLEASEDAEEDPINFEAALWVARLSSADATDEDRATFENWRSADPAHAEAYAELEAWRHTMGRAPDPREHKRKPPKGLAALAVTCGLSALAAYETGLLDRLRADAWTDVGGINQTVLTDGSRAYLNTDTAIALRYTSEERGIEMLRGEAEFDVVPDRERPFVVRGNGLNVRAVGTRFFVRVDGAPNPVGVAEGRVIVETRNDHETVGVGEVVARGADEQLSVERADIEQALAWREGKLVASGQPLADILVDLNRYRRGRIVLIDSALGARKFTGTLDVRDTDDALVVLAASMRLKVIRLTPLLVLVRSAS
ncbi:UNVERIFIED_CONTAM: FecR family protein [Methylobacteriaceae bacterium AG10]|nr:FecR family protein [Methylobacteriaceae bacterium AG10]